MLTYVKLILAIIIILYLCKNINKSSLNREKITAYECGFQEFDEARNKYYIKFYLVAILFLIFDLETILLYSISLYTNFLSFNGYFIFYFFYLILCLGLVYEINKSIILY